MDAAEILAAAGRRQADIDQRIREAEAKLKARAEARKGKPGRMTSAEQAIEDRLNELENARALLTSEEYEKKRSEILSSL